MQGRYQVVMATATPGLTWGGGPYACRRLGRYSPTPTRPDVDITVDQGSRRIRRDFGRAAAILDLDTCATLCNDSTKPIWPSWLRSSRWSAEACSSWRSYGAIGFSDHYEFDQLRPLAFSKVRLEPKGDRHHTPYKYHAIRMPGGSRS
jgi:hypothetical protein